MAISDAEPAEPDDSEVSEQQRAEIHLAIDASLPVVDKILEVLAEIDVDSLTLDEFLELRARMGMLWGELDRHARTITQQFGFGGAVDCMRQYMLNHVGEPIENYQLAGTACALEWARRKRQLVVQDGWNITTGGPGVEELTRGQYRLENETPDGSRAARWSMLNNIRRQPGGAIRRILSLLQSAFPDPVTREDLDYVAKIQSRDRRVRDLEEAGWDISGHDDDPFLPDGWYRLNSMEIGPPRSREAIKLRTEIFQAKSYTCELCGARPEEGHKSVILHIHHKTFVSEGGTNEADNLEVVCRPCHAGIHSLSESKVEDELLNPSADPYLQPGSDVVENGSSES
jgi:hypothetical protein